MGSGDTDSLGNNDDDYPICDICGETGSQCKCDMVVIKPEKKIDISTTHGKITVFLNQMKKFLHEKNRRYGDAALSPINIFSKKESGNSILIRIDDKLNRIKNAETIRKNDVIDLIGYLVLLSIDHSHWLDLSDLID